MLIVVVVAMVLTAVVLGGCLLSVAEANRFGPSDAQVAAVQARLDAGFAEGDRVGMQS